MGVVTCEKEVPCAIPPSRIFKALVYDINHLVVKIMPEVVESVDLLDGDGGVGTIRQINLHAGPFQTKTLKERIDAIDEEKLFFSYTIIDKDFVKGVEKVQNDVTFEATSGGAGTIMKRKSLFYTTGDNQIDENEIKARNEQVIGFLKAIEAYLLANPDA